MDDLLANFSVVVHGLGVIFETFKYLIAIFTVLLFYLGISIILYPDSSMGFLGIQKSESKTSVGVGMLFAGMVLAVLQPFLEMFSLGIFNTASPLESLDFTDKVVNENLDLWVNGIRVVGTFLSLYGYIAMALIIGGAAFPSDREVSNAKALFVGFVGSLGIILAGNYMSTYQVGRF